MDVARQGQQFLLGQHGDGLLPNGLGRLFQVEVLRHGDVEHIVCPGCALCHQGFEHLLRRLPQRLRHGHAVDGALRVVAVGGVGYLLLLQRPHDVGLFLFALCHGITPLRRSCRPPAPTE